MENRIFEINCKLDAVKRLLMLDGNILSTLSPNSEAARSVQREIDELCRIESESYNELRKELFGRTEKYA